MELSKEKLSLYSVNKSNQEEDKFICVWASEDKMTTVEAIIKMNEVKEFITLEEAKELAKENTVRAITSKEVIKNDISRKTKKA